MVEPDHCRISLRRQCELLALSRSSWYFQPCAREDEENLALMRAVDKEFTKHPFFGSRQMRNVLRRQGWLVNRKRVQRLMRKMGLVSVAPKPGLSKPAPGHKIYPYLLRNLPVVRPNQVWCADITYIRLSGGFVYLVAVMDWFILCGSLKRATFPVAGATISWELSSSLDESFCCSALERAFRLFGKPEIFNTDQGAQFTGAAFIGLLSGHKVQISMDDKGRAMDNIFVERLWSSL